VHAEFQWGDHLEDRGVDGNITLKMIFNKCFRGIDWIDLAQYRNTWWAVVNALMKLEVS
jgi:hypothetical protein